jgi:D-alanyl-D-alanine carboxypeptidase/D-alanyl-D-alanine-endopeptidase (penicillin-binding protein 4)
VGDFVNNYFLCAIFALSATVSASWSWAGKPTFPNITEELNSLAKKHGAAMSDVGIYASIGEGDNLEVVLDNNGQRIMIPASITKVATASTVLAHFPPGYKFKTQIYSTGSIQDGVLKGDLYLKGGGDPSFVSENLWFLVNVFTRTPIKKVEGNIIVDDSLFDKVRFDESRQKARVDRAYDAPVGAMSFNWNSVNLFVRPGKVGGPAQVTVDPENDYVRLVNHAKTASSGGNKLIADRNEEKKFPGDMVLISGSISEKYPETAVFLSISQPDLWSGYNLKSFLSQRGITVTGTIKNGVLPDKADLRAESDSKSIEEILADMNKFSNNYVAEMLTKNLGSLKAKPATLASGVAMINDHMVSLGLPKDQYVIENPSGLTRENRMSPFAMWKILQHLRQDFQVQPEFLASLPIAGIDGTLKKRMKESQAERWVRAKTGSLNGVVSLAGYAGLKDGRVITFTFIYNGSTDETKIRAFFDQLLIYLVK